MKPIRIGMTYTFDRSVSSERLAAHIQSESRRMSRDWAEGVMRLARINAPVRTGNLKRRIKARKIEDTVWEVESGAPYSRYVEYGTSKARAQPFFRPALNVMNRRFRNDLGTMFRRGVRGF